MATDWQVGDLAVCVDNAPRPETYPGIEKRLTLGAIYRVIGLQQSFRGDLNLFLDGVPHQLGLGSAANRFRKVSPDKREACEPEFVMLLKRAKRPVSA